MLCSLFLFCAPSGIVSNLEIFMCVSDVNSHMQPNTCCYLFCYKGCESYFKSKRFVPALSPVFYSYQDKYFILVDGFLFHQLYSTLDSLRRNSTDVSWIDHQLTINHGKIFSSTSQAACQRGCRC